ncbi:DODA-type extradiol aromatic ring-opening family dioxygenase [Candidatus Harpocratesius sp.]
MVITSLNIVPHGMQIIPGLDPKAPPEFSKMHQSMLELIKILRKEKPDTIILFTPHGYQLEQDFCLYYANSLRAYYPVLNRSNIDGTQIHSTIEFSSDTELLDDIWVKFNSLKNPAFKLNKITLGSRYYPIPLGWGASVPLYYCYQHDFRPKIVVVSLPRARFNVSKFHTTLTKCGEFFGKFALNTTKRTSIFFSGDLAHTHQDSENFTFHSSSKKYDESLLSWIQNFSKKKIRGRIITIPRDIFNLEKTALACGLSTLSIMEGVINVMKEEKEKTYENEHIDLLLNSTILQYIHPTYFGMALIHISLNSLKSS